MKNTIPLIDQMKQSARDGEFLLTPWTAELARRYDAAETMGRGSRFLFGQETQARRERCALIPQPLQHAPDRHRMKRSLIDPCLAGRRQVSKDAPIGLDDLPIRTIIALDVRMSELEKDRSGITLIREYESRDNR